MILVKLTPKTIFF